MHDSPDRSGQPGAVESAETSGSAPGSTIPGGSAIPTLRVERIDSDDDEPNAEPVVPESAPTTEASAETAASVEVGTGVESATAVEASTGAEGTAAPETGGGPESPPAVETGAASGTAPAAASDVGTAIAESPIGTPEATPSYPSTPRVLQLVAARTGAAFELRAGERIEIVDQAGKQVCDFVAIVQGDPDEYLSPSHTRAVLRSIMLGPGADLVSNRRNPLLTLEEDTVGRHDLLFPACDARRYLDDFDLPDHENCRDNLANALAPYGVSIDRVPDPVNFFMHATVLHRGQLEVREPLSEAGDRVVLRAKKDLVVAVSACPQDQNPTNGYNPTDLLVRIYAS
jgi:uncharacterized protein YcgI (DUF1989 family)